MLLIPGELDVRGAVWVLANVQRATTTRQMPPTKAVLDVHNFGSLLNSKSL
jgi:hypothetical protein